MNNFSVIRGFIRSYSGFHPPKLGVSSTIQFGVSSAKTSCNHDQYSCSENVTRARVFNIINDFNAQKQNLGGALPPLQTTLQEGKAKGMRYEAHSFFFLVAVTTKLFANQALLFIPRPLIKAIRGFRGINRTLRAWGWTVKLFYSWSAVMQIGSTNRLSGWFLPTRKLEREIIMERGMNFNEILNEDVVKVEIEKRLSAGQDFELINLSTGEKMVFGEKMSNQLMAERRELVLEVATAGAVREAERLNKCEGMSSSQAKRAAQNAQVTEIHIAAAEFALSAGLDRSQSVALIGAKGENDEKLAAFMVLQAERKAENEKLAAEKADRDIENERKAHRFQKNGLQGTDRQIEWALKIREKVIQQHSKDNEVLEALLRKIKSAPWWIKNRELQRRQPRILAGVEEFIKSQFNF